MSASVALAVGIITSERAQRAVRVLSYLREKSEYSRPARPDLARGHVFHNVGTAYDKRSSLMNTLGCKRWHGYHIASVPVMVARAKLRVLC